MKKDETAGAEKARPLIVQYGDALARRANALFGDTLESRANRAGGEAANRARSELSSGDYAHLIGSDDCADDCSGHDAGFAWARSRKIEDSGACPNGRGDSFEDGCRAYGEQIRDAQSAAHDAVMNGKGPPPS